MPRRILKLISGGLARNGARHAPTHAFTTQDIVWALLKQPKMLIFDEATSSLDQNTAEHFALTINQLKGRVGMIFITHAMPKNLQVDEIARIGQGSLSAVAGQSEAPSYGAESAGYR